MNTSNRVNVCAVLLLAVVLDGTLYAKGNGGNSGQTGSSAGSTGGASQGQQGGSSGSVETAILSFDAIDQLGESIGASVRRTLCGAACAAQKIVMVMDDTSYAALLVYESFAASATTLKEAFARVQDEKQPRPSGHGVNPTKPAEPRTYGLDGGSPSGAGGGGGGSPAWEGYLSALSQIKSASAVSAQTFQPDLLPVVTAISRTINGPRKQSGDDPDRIKVIAANAPFVDPNFAVSRIEGLLRDIYEEQGRAFNKCCTSIDKTKTLSPNQQYYQSLSTALVNFVATIQSGQSASSGSPAPNLMTGAYVAGKIADSRAVNIHILRLVVEAAGRQRTRFFAVFVVGLLYPSAYV
jgi:hypothetical protein